LYRRFVVFDYTDARNNQERGGYDKYSIYYHYPAPYSVNHKPRYDVSHKLDGVTDLDDADQILGTCDSKVVSENMSVQDIPICFRNLRVTTHGRYPVINTTPETCCARNIM
jgi:hypothetical protein